MVKLNDRPDITIICLPWAYIHTGVKTSVICIGVKPRIITSAVRP